MNPSVASLTPGQKVWLSGLAVRMVKFNRELRDILNTLNSCEKYTTVSANLKNIVIKQSTFLSISSSEYHSALFCLKSEKIIKEMTPLHNMSERATVWSHFRRQSIFFPPVRWIRWYLGDVVGFYFAWLRTYCLTLVVPSIFGLITWVLVSFSDDLYPNQSTQQLPISVFRIFYGLGVVVWALACNKIWRRQQSQLAEDWMSPVFADAADVSGWVDSHMEQLRPAFHGIPRESPVTGEVELHFPASARRVVYFISASATFICVLMALFANFLLLNLECVINPERSPNLHLRPLGCLCGSEGIFNPKNGAFKFLPGILHPLVVYCCNQVIFRRIAEKLTNMENHKIQFNWDRSFLVKRFLFEAVDAYASPFYLGLILVDWDALQSFLLTTFATDSIRRLLFECFVPWASSFWRSRRASATGAHKKSDDAPQGVESSEALAVRAAVFGVEYEPFDDFLEMVLEHGYIVLFAVAYPPYLAVIAFVCAWVESFFDAFKLLQLVRRPMAQWLHRQQNIWLMLLSVQAWLALFSNLCLLTRYTQWSLFTLVLLEHALIGIGLFIELAFSNTPIAAKNAFRKRVYERYKRTQIIG